MLKVIMDQQFSLQSAICHAWCSCKSPGVQ